MVELTLNDMVGYNLMPHITYYMLLTGHWVGAVPGPTPKLVKTARALGGTISWITLIYVASASCNGILQGSSLTDVSVNLIISTTTLSAFHKYCTFIEQEQSLSRLGKWLKSVAEYRKTNNIPDTASDRVLKKTLKVFYCSTVMAPVLLSCNTIFTGKTYNLKFSGIENTILQKFLMIVAINAMAWEILVDASILMNSLFVFRGELKRAATEWRSLTFDPSNPEQFHSDLRASVQKHVELLVIFRDLKRFCNSMFGYQVFQVEFTTCSLIYGIAKGAAVLDRAAYQVLPTSTASILEFWLLCWSGEEIREGFQDIFRNIYKTNWYEAPLRDKRSMSIILEYSKHPITLTGFSVFTATLETFSEAMKQSFSMYTLLKTVL